MVHVKAAAKINLFLHVTGRRDDGYHLLRSLVCFSDLHDVITITGADDFSFSVSGQFCGLLGDNHEDNLVVRAAKLSAKITGCDLTCGIHLEKNLPVGAGIGGGSADAAAVICGLLQYWNVDFSGHIRRAIMQQAASLGADIPVCLHGGSAIMSGIGENITAVDIPENMHALLVYPAVHINTPEIFKRFDSPFNLSWDDDCTAKLQNVQKDGFYALLDNAQNDLNAYAVQIAPQIGDLLDDMKALSGCRMARMTGSGSSCFALFDDAAKAKAAREQIKKIRPDYWAETTIFNAA